MNTFFVLIIDICGYYLINVFLIMCSINTFFVLIIKIFYANIKYVKLLLIIKKHIFMCQLNINIIKNTYLLINIFEIN